MATQSSAELYEQIRENWWKRDYSWEGLANYQTDARGEVESLQSYWKHVFARLTLGPRYLASGRDIDAAISGWLKSFDGKTWTPFHYPFVSNPENSGSPKYGDKRSMPSPDDAFKLAPTFSAILDLVDAGFLKFADFSGCLFDFPIVIERPRKLSAKFDSCEFSRAFVCNGEIARFESSTSNTLFYSRDPISGYGMMTVAFSLCRFDIDANFSGAIIQAGCHFVANYFARRAIFKKATIGGARPTFFDHCSFSNASFVSASLDTVDFWECNFEGSTVFGPTSEAPDRIKDVSFLRAEFHSACNFSFSTFEGRSSFANAVFRDYTDFEGCNFLEASSKENRLENFANFTGTAFRDRVTFSGANFVVPAFFLAGDGSNPAGADQFHDVSFEPGRSHMPIEPARTKSEAKSGGARDFPLTPGDASSRLISTLRSSDPASAFSLLLRDTRLVPLRSTVFKQAVSFAGRKFKAQANFHGVRFEDEAAFDGTEFGREPFFGAVSWGDLRQVDDYDREFIRLEIDYRTGGALSGRSKRKLARAVRDEITPYRNRKLTRMEASFRCLKRAMETFRNKEDEAKFFEREISTRLARSDISFLERIIAGLYRVSSSFGASITRPLIWIVVVSTAMFVAYYSWLYSITGNLLWDKARVFDVGALILERAFAPLSIWDPQYTDTKNSAARDLLAQAPLAFRAVSTAHSILLLVLVFLFLLAIRRRFQMK